MSEDDRNYYRRRVAEERTAAHSATDPAAANAHRIIAERYAALLEQASQPELGQTASARGS